METIRRGLTIETDRSTKLNALRDLTTIVDSQQMNIDEIANVFGILLCDIVRVEKSDACTEKSISVLIELLKKSKCSDKLSSVVVEAVEERITLTCNEDVRIQLASLLEATTICVPEHVLAFVLRDECVQVVVRTVESLRTGSAVSPGVLVPLLAHRSSRVRIAAIAAVDRCLMRTNPWKDTYPVIQLMGALERNEIPVSDFFDPNSIRINYFSKLTFDSNVSVRRVWFKQLVNWVTTLADKEDVDIHLCPYLLTGLFDPILGAEVHAIMSTEIGKDDECKNWVQKKARRFIQAFMSRIDCDFLNCSAENALRMLNTILSFIDEKAIEWFPNILRTCQRNYRKHKKLCEDILRSIGRCIDPAMSWELLSQYECDDQKVYWWILNNVSSEWNSPIVGKVCNEIINRIEPINCAYMVEVFVRLAKESSADETDIVWKGLLLSHENKDTIDSIVDSVVISHNFSMIQIIEQRLITYKSFFISTIVSSYLRLLRRTNFCGSFDSVVEFILDSEITDPNVIYALLELDKDKALDACTRMISVDETILPVVQKMLTEHEFKNLESLASALLATDSLDEARINCLTLISKQKGLSLDQSEDCLGKIRKNFVTSNPLLIPSLEFLVSVNHAIDVELISVLPNIAIDGDETVNALIGTVMRHLFKQWPNEYIGKLLFFEKEGYIASSHYLGKFIL